MLSPLNLFAHSLFAICHVIAYPRNKDFDGLTNGEDEFHFGKSSFSKNVPKFKNWKRKINWYEKSARWKVRGREMGWIKNFGLGSVVCEEYVLFPWLKRVRILEFSMLENVIRIFFSQVSQAVIVSVLKSHPWSDISDLMMKQWKMNEPSLLFKYVKIYDLDI